MSTGYYTGLCDCLGDLEVCCCVMWCGWTLVPSSKYWAESRGEQCSLCHCCALAHPIWTRANIRALNNMKSANYCGDCFIYCCCFECATCQDGRELKRLKSLNASGQTLIPNSNVVVRDGPSYAQPPSGYAPPPGPPPMPQYAPAPGSYAAPAPAPPSFGAPQPGYGVPPPQAGYGAPPPPQPGYGVPPAPTSQEFGVPQQQPQGFAPSSQGFAPPPQQPQGFAPPPQQPQGFAPPPQQPQGFAPPPQQPQGFAPPPQQPQGFAPPPQDFGAPPTFPNE